MICCVKSHYARYHIKCRIALHYIISEHRTNSHYHGLIVCRINIPYSKVTSLEKRRVLRRSSRPAGKSQAKSQTGSLTTEQRGKAAGSQDSEMVMQPAGRPSLCARRPRRGWSDPPPVPDEEREQMQQSRASPWSELDESQRACIASPHSQRHRRVHMCCDACPHDISACIARLSASLSSLRAEEGGLAGTLKKVYRESIIRPEVGA